MRKSLYLSLAIAVLAAGALGQTAGQHRGIFFGTSIYATTTSAVGELTAKNQFTTYPTSPSGPWVHWGNMWAATQNIDNQSLIIPALIGAGPSDYAFVIWDPILPGIIGTLWKTGWAGRFPSNVTEITLDSNGDLVGYDSLVNQVVRYDRMKSAWSGTTLKVSVGVNGGLGGFEWDKLNGGFLLANSRWCPTTTICSPPQNLVRVSADLTVSSILATTQDRNVQANMGGTMLDNGDWVVSSYTSLRYSEVKAGSSVWTPGPAAVGITTTDVGAEKFAAPKRGYFAALVASTTSQTMGYVDATTTPHTVTQLASLQALPNGVTGWFQEATPLYQRDLCTVRTGKATWDILINPDPLGSFANKSYIVAASLLGASPPIPLPDGRQIFITPDLLTVATITNPYPPLLVGNIGKLSPFGLGTAKLDLKLLGTAANGNVIHFCGVILDPAAPSGIGWVLDPWAFVIDVQP